MTWLLVAILGIIWIAFLLPSRRQKVSPASSVEEFERKMNSLADAHARPGRWVIMPRKGGRLHEGAERSRFKVRRRRRRVFMVLAELTFLALLMGFFPPLHRMLLGAAVLGGVLFLYTVLLVKLRADEIKLARRRAELARHLAARERRAGSRPVPAPRGVNGHTPQRVTRADAHIAVRPGPSSPPERVKIIDDDVHVVVYRSDEVDVETLRAAARR